MISQDGALDASFTPNISSTTFVRSIAQQEDNKILIGGNFNNGGANLIRLLEDGTTDASFNLTTSLFGVNDIAIQENGKVIVVGSSSHNFIKRLNEDGSLDTSFNFPGSTENGWINKVHILENGKILIAGIFSNIGGNPREAVALLNTNGSLDTSFNLNLPPQTGIRAMDVQPDGKILIAGQNDETSTQFRIFKRYLQSGIIDTTFNGDEEYYIYDIETQQNGKIMIAGPFTEYMHTTRYGVARLHSSGALDDTFNSYNAPHNNGNNHTIFDVAIVGDGSYFINGSFTLYNQVATNYIAKVNSDGTIDANFDTGTGPDHFVNETYVQQDGKILIGGDFNTYNGIAINGIARLGNSLLTTLLTTFDNSITLYPNPFNDIITISSQHPLTEEATLTIYTMSGKLLKFEKVTPQNRLLVDGLSSGMYLLKIEDGLETHTIKIIKK